MLFRQNKLFVNKSVDIHITNTGHLYVSGPLGIISNKLIFSFDFINSDFFRSVSRRALKYLLSSLRLGVYSVTLGYYVFVDLIGLGYKIKKVTRLIYRFYLGQAHFVYVYVPSTVLVLAFQNRITLFSIYSDKLFSLSINIMLLRKLNAYKLRGLIRPGQIIILKEGKQR